MRSDENLLEPPLLDAARLRERAACARASVAVSAAAVLVGVAAVELTLCWRCMRGTRSCGAPLFSLCDNCAPGTCSPALTFANLLDTCDGSSPKGVSEMMLLLFVPYLLAFDNGSWRADAAVVVDVVVVELERRGKVAGVLLAPVSALCTSSLCTRLLGAVAAGCTRNWLRELGTNRVDSVGAPNRSACVGRDAN